LSATYTEYYVQLINKRTKGAIDDDTGLCNVLTASTAAEATIYSDENGTSASNPLTMTDGIIRFFTAIAITTVDLSILTASGHAVFIEALTPSQHRIDVDTDNFNDQRLIIPFCSLTASNIGVIDTGFDLLAGMQVKDIYAHITTAGTGGLFSVGVSADLSATSAKFLLSANGSATGWKVYDVPVFTSNSVGSMISGVQVLGPYLCSFGTGVNTAVDLGGVGWFVKKKYQVTAVTSLVMFSNTTGTESYGYLYVVYDLVPTIGN